MSRSRVTPIGGSSYSISIKTTVHWREITKSLDRKVWKILWERRTVDLPQPWSNAWQINREEQTYTKVSQLSYTAERLFNLR